MQKKLKLDPYSYIFPFGLLSAFVGLSLWILFKFQWVSFYPRTAHANLMYYGFLWSYIAGFLMTAIPKMTQSKPAERWEVFCVIGLVILNWIFNIQNQILLSIYVSFFQIAFLIYFVFKRFNQNRKMPFAGFIFLPMALGIGLVGNAYEALHFSGTTSAIYFMTAQAFILNLICGLGSRLIPALCRVPSAVSPDSFDRNKIFFELILIAVLMNVGFIFEVLEESQLSSILKFLTLVYIAIRYFKIFIPSSTKTFLSLGLKISVMMMLVGYFLGIFSTSNSLAILHLVYIGGFAAITLLVSTRVTLAHGGASLDQEIASQSIFVLTGCFVISALARWSLGQNIASYLLVVSIVFFLLALTIWMWKFLKILLRTQSHT